MAAAKYTSFKPSPRPARALALWHAVLTRSMDALPFDLSSRQMGILLTVYLSDEPMSVKLLSEELGISKPAICRALDVLEQTKLLKRQREKEDKRNVTIQRTYKGISYLNKFSDIILKVAR